MSVGRVGEDSSSFPGGCPWSGGRECPGDDGEDRDPLVDVPVPGPELQVSTLETRGVGE